MSQARKFDAEVSFPSDTGEGLKIQEDILDELRRRRYSERVIFGVRLSMEEALVNAIKHGNRMDPEKLVHVRYRITDEHFEIEIEDEGAGFHPDDVPDPTAPENLERPCGRGLLLMRSYMTECEFLPPGNICRMRRVRE